MRLSSLRAAIAGGVLVLTGCAEREPSMWLAEWTLESPEGGTETVELPRDIVGRLPKGPSVYHLRTTVALPEAMRGRPLTLAITHFSALASLTADGEVAPALDQSSFDTYRQTGGLRFAVPAKVTSDGEVTLDLAVSHRSMMSGYIRGRPILTVAPDGGTRFSWSRIGDRTIAILALAATLGIALAFGAMGASDASRRHDRAVVVGGLAASTFPAWQMGLLQSVFGPYDAAVACVGIGLSAVASMKFVYGYLGLPSPSRLFDAALALLVVLAVTFSSPFGAVRIPAVFAASLGGAVIVAHFILLSRELRQRPVRTNAVLALLGWPLTGVLAVTDAIFAARTSVFLGVQLTALGMAAVCVLQWVALAREHTQLRHRAEALAGSLGQEVERLDQSFREVERLNLELRKQLEVRGERLAVALAQRATLGAGVALKAGDRLGDRYRIVRAIGSGAMGTVFEARREPDEERVAVKVVRSTLSVNALARMAREAQLLARVRHPNVVDVLDVDLDASGTLFLAMAFVDGETLADYAERNEPVSWVLDVAGQLASGLCAIHAAQVVHRDLKPSNVLVDGPSATPRVRIVDFGVSQRIDGPREEASDDDEEAGDALPETETLGLTRPGARVGTPLYMAPEVVQGQEAGFPADVYALGLVAVELLAGRTRERGEDPRGLLAEAPGLDPATRALLAQAIAPDPAARPTAVVMRDHLAAYRAAPLPPVEPRA